MLKTKIFLILTLLISLNAGAAGTADRGGGNAQVAEFYQLAQHFKAYMEKNPSIDTSLSRAKLRSIILSLSVTAVKGPLELNGTKVDAINYPGLNKIELDDASFSARPPAGRYQIVVHELLGLLRLPDLHYERSGYLAKTTANLSEPAAPTPAIQSIMVCTIVVNPLEFDPPMHTTLSTYSYYGEASTEAEARVKSKLECLQGGWKKKICETGARDAECWRE